MTAVRPLRVLFVLPVLGQPRDAKRISMLRQAGFAVEAVAFERDYHSGRLPDCPVERLGRIAHGRYLQRSLKLAAALPAMRRAMRRNSAVYASGPDMALLAIIAGIGLKRPVIVEVGDIRKVQVSAGAAGGLVRMLDRFIARTSSLLVATTSDFIDGYYRNRLKVRTPALVIENKMEKTSGVAQQDAASASRDVPAANRPLRIGYFGLLRCDWSWKVLEALALSQTRRIEIVVAGYPMHPHDIPERAASSQNIEFRGEYRSPQDLPALYGGVDLVWACYPNPELPDTDWKWAQQICRSNRFYESCYFQRPIISLAHSGDATQVERYGIGIVLQGRTIEEITQTIAMISDVDVLRWRANLSRLPRSVYELSAETEELKNVVLAILDDP